MAIEFSVPKTADKDQHFTVKTAMPSLFVENKCKCIQFPIFQKEI